MAEKSDAPAMKKATLRVGWDCKACFRKAEKIIAECCQEMKMDSENNLAEVGGTNLDVDALVMRLKKKLRRSVQIVTPPAEKEEGGGGANNKTENGSGGGGGGGGHEESCPGCKALQQLRLPGIAPGPGCLPQNSIVPSYRPPLMDCSARPEHPDGTGPIHGPPNGYSFEPIQGPTHGAPPSSFLRIYGAPNTQGPPVSYAPYPYPYPSNGGSMPGYGYGYPPPGYMLGYRYPNQNSYTADPIHTLSVENANACAIM